MKKRILKISCLIIAFAGTYACSDSSVVRYATESIKTPTLFAKGIIATDTHNEFNIEFSPDGKTAYFTRRKEGEPQKILVTQFENNEWSQPKTVSFSNSRDEMPSITPDGKQLYFASVRPILNREESKGNFDMNVWVTERINDSWSMPKPVSETINQIQIEGEEWPSSNESTLYTQDGKTFYYSSMRRNSKAIGIYTTILENNTFSKPKRIEGLLDKDTYWTSTPVLSPDGNYLLFNAYGVKGAVGGEDIFVSKKTENGWSKAVNLGTIVNTKQEEGGPRFSRDGYYFFFTRDNMVSVEEDGIWSIYFIETKYLQLDSLFTKP